MDFTKSIRSDDSPRQNIWGLVLHPVSWILTSVWKSVWLPPSHSASVPEELVLLFFFSPPPSPHTLTQMLEAICRAALSCVYNKEVLVWTGRRRSDGCRWRAGGHRAVDAGAERCQICLWPASESMQANVSAFSIILLFSTSHHLKKKKLEIHQTFLSHASGCCVQPVALL